jgi:hypothetical protein
MQRGLSSFGRQRGRELALIIFVAQLLQADSRCVACHPREVAGYAKSAMARSLRPMRGGFEISAPPDGAVEHAASKTRFFIRSSPDGMTQGYIRQHESSEQKMAFLIGSGNHATGYLIQMGDHLFQSPLSYYTARRLWDLAPGYESDPHPDFTRPVTAECLFCHSGKPLPVAETLNRYQAGTFAEYAISCDRCHGDPAAHLKNPVSGSIVNPTNLKGAARASVCEQCHLVGDTRVPNPGRAISDFRPGQTLETFYTTYVGARASGESIKVVSHAEQLALSQCARRSGDKLWCGTCHNPHDQPAQSASYYRDRCLTCHVATLEKTHAAPDRDCVACHMPKSPTVDGNHTAFTNHRIARPGQVDSIRAKPDTLTAWREPEPALRDRNRGIALITFGVEHGSPTVAIDGYRLLTAIEKNFPDDPALLTSIGNVLMKAKRPSEALTRFEKVVTLKPEYAPNRLNVAIALATLYRPSEAIEQGQKALALDPLFEAGVEFLDRIYREEGQPEKADQLLNEYENAVSIATH